MFLGCERCPSCRPEHAICAELEMCSRLPPAPDSDVCVHPLSGFECRCGNVYCGVHRYSDVHNCSYNYKADAAEKIRKENPVVVGEKIQKI